MNEIKKSIQYLNEKFHYLEEKFSSLDKKFKTRGTNSENLNLWNENSIRQMKISRKHHQ
jgi:hypothetical protein